MQPILQGPRLELTFVRLPAHMAEGLRAFRKITGLTAVTSLAASLPASGKPAALFPPVHPRCAERLRSVRAAPCRKQWRMHMQISRRSGDAESHTCPLGLRCACVPVRFDNRLVGVAKVVADSGTTPASFSAATDVLELVVARASEQALSSALSEEVEALRQSVAQMRQPRLTCDRPATGSEMRAAVPGRWNGGLQDSRLVERALAHLKLHYSDPNLSLPAVANALGCNPRYLTSRFTRVTGERMHGHLTRLRVEQACGLLLGNGVSVKEAAWASGFRGPTQMARALRRRVGVSPREYRRIFSGS